MYQFLSDFDRGFPATDFNRLFEHFDRMFEGFDRGYARTRVANDDYWFEETDTGYTVRAHLPGIRQDDINVTARDGVLTVSGKRQVSVPEGYEPRRRERMDYDFSRSFRLPTTVDVASTDAHLEDGVLTLSLRKHEKAQPRQIAVRAS